MNELLKKLSEGNTDILNWQNGGQTEWENVVRSTFELMPNGLIISKKSRQQVSEADFNTMALSLARPHLRIRSIGRYIPAVLDTRSSEQKREAAAAVEKVTEAYFQKLGYVFKLEHLGDLSVRESVRAEIAQRFIYEAGDSEGRLVFRQNSDGFLSKPITPEELFNKLCSEYLDHKRTAHKEIEMKRAAYAKILAANGLDEHKLQPKQRTQIDSEVKEALEQDRQHYTKKRLPFQGDLTPELERRALFSQGIPDKRLASLQELRNIDAFVRGGLDAVNDIKPLNYKAPNGPEWESWSGLASLDNKEGVALRADQIK
jgi:hypothetical protein